MNPPKPKRPRGCFAVKRTKLSKSYQFYEPHPKNREMIEAIAPDGGNFETMELIEREAYAKAISALKKITKNIGSGFICAEIARQTLKDLGEIE